MPGALGNICSRNQSFLARANIFIELQKLTVEWVAIPDCDMVL